MLTPKQYELLRYIDGRMKEGATPSFDEMRDAMDLRSKSGIHRMITSLEQRGFIRRLPHRARTLEIVRLPEGLTAKPANDTGNVTVPVMGRIAAGTPISALQEKTNELSFPPAMLGHGEHYALEVVGDSMKDAGIVDGDIALIRKVPHAATGDIVVALIDDAEATLKRFRRRGTSVALEPANPDYETRILPESRVAVQGRLVGIWRDY